MGLEKHETGTCEGRNGVLQRVESPWDDPSQKPPTPLGNTTGAVINKILHHHITKVIGISGETIKKKATAEPLAPIFFSGQRWCLIDCWLNITHPRDKNAGSMQCLRNIFSRTPTSHVTSNREGGARGGGYVPCASGVPCRLIKCCEVTEGVVRYLVGVRPLDQATPSKFCGMSPGAGRGVALWRQWGKLSEGLRSPG